MGYNRLAYFLVGTLLGATTAALTKSEKGQKILSTVVQGACHVTGTVLERVEILKEDIEDYLAEAKCTKEETIREESATEQKPAIKAPAKKTKTAKKAVKTTI